MTSLAAGKPGPDVLAHAGGNVGTSAWAPDLLKLGDHYCMYYCLSGRSHRAVVALLTNKTLDPTSPDYQWQDGGPIAWSLGDGKEDLHAIDPGVFLDPTNGSLWLTYGSYFGTIRLAELDPKTGKRLHNEQSQTILANNSEASDLMYHDGWYYLLTNHGTCCAGATSTYNIRVGRSKVVTGPYLDEDGVDMARGGGKLFAAAEDRKVGPGHFGLLDLGDGIQKFSCHYEADLDRGGTSVLDIRPLLWRDGWPIAGTNTKGGDFQLMSKHSGTALELAVPGIPLTGPRARNAAGAPPTSAPAPALPSQSAAQVSPNWPPANIDVRLAPYLLQAQQKWTITPVDNSGGYPGSPFFKIILTGTDRALAATDDDELTSVPSFTAAPQQLCRLDELPDGSYRIMPKSAPIGKDPLALTSIGRSTITLAPFTPDNNNQQWLLKPQ